MYTYIPTTFLLYCLYFLVIMLILILCDISQMGRRVDNNGDIRILSILNSRSCFPTIRGCKNELEGVGFHSICDRISWSGMCWYTCFPPSCHLFVSGWETGVLEFYPA